MDSTQPQVTLTWVDATGDTEQLQADLPVRIGRFRNQSIAVNRDRVKQQDAIIESVPDTGFVLKRLSDGDVTMHGESIDSVVLEDDDSFMVGQTTVKVNVPQMEAIRETTPDETIPTVAVEPTAQNDGVILNDEDTHQDDSDMEDPVTRKRYRFPPNVFMQPDVSIEDLKATGLPVEEITYLTIGGGLGSFTWVDHLRIAGVPVDQIVAIGFESVPYARYKRLCENSQIPLHERLRSDSGSTPDNIWGWPGYAVREIFTDLKGGRFTHAARLAWQIFHEPMLVQTYTPRSGRVFDSLDREAARIDWDQIWRYGRVRSIRKTTDGRYAVAYSQTQGSQRAHKLIVGKYVHVAIGYPGIRLLKDLQTYREKYGDFKKVVNAYEPHDWIYEHLAEKGGVVMLRGRGIVASRVLQRIWELRQRNDKIGVIHLMRTPVQEGHKFGPSQRVVDSHWEFQPFNWPKSAWTGIGRQMLESSDDAARDRLLDEWGGTTTADRQDWRDIVQEGLRQGWYDNFFGNVTNVEPTGDGHILTHVQGHGTQPQATFKTNFIVDSTGLIAGLESHNLLNDLVNHYDLPRNPKGRLAVDNAFALKGMDNGTGRMYASGVMTLGGPHAAVDSFLGLQYAALAITDDLRKKNAPELNYVDGWRSVNQFIKWARGKQP